MVVNIQYVLNLRHVPIRVRSARISRRNCELRKLGGSWPGALDNISVSSNGLLTWLYYCYPHQHTPITD